MKGDHKPINKAIITGLSFQVWVSLSPPTSSFHHFKFFFLGVGNVFEVIGYCFELKGSFSVGNHWLVVLQMPASEGIPVFINVPLVHGRQRNTVSTDPTTSSIASTQMISAVAQILSWVSVPYFQLFAAYSHLIAQNTILAWKKYPINGLWRDLSLWNPPAFLLKGGFSWC